MGTVISTSGLRQSHFKAWCWVGFNLGSYPPHTHTPRTFIHLKAKAYLKATAYVRYFGTAILGHRHLPGARLRLGRSFFLVIPTSPAPPGCVRFIFPGALQKWFHFHPGYLGLAPPGFSEPFTFATGYGSPTCSCRKRNPS